MIGREAASNDRGCEGAGGVNGGEGVTTGKQVAGEEGKTVGKGGHEGRAVLLMDNHVVDKAQDGGQEELEEETAGNALVVVLEDGNRVELISA